MYPTIERVTIIAGNSWVGIGGDVRARYDVRLRDLSIRDIKCAWIAAFGWIAEIDTLWRTAAGRFVARFDGCSITADKRAYSRCERPRGLCEDHRQSSLRHDLRP